MKMSFQINWSVGETLNTKSSKKLFWKLFIRDFVELVDELAGLVDDKLKFVILLNASRCQSLIVLTFCAILFC